MGDGTYKSPYTRDDVMWLIDDNKGKAEGLDLSGKVFEKDISLRRLDLSGIILKKAKFLHDSLQFEGAHLEEIDLSFANLEEADLGVACIENAFLQSSNLKHAYIGFTNLKGAILSDTNLSGASLVNADLTHVDFDGACLEGVYLNGAEISTTTVLNNANWGNYIIGEEREGDEKRREGKGDEIGYLDSAEEIYRRLKIWYTEHGIYDVAGKFFYREMEAKRKLYSWKSNFWSKLWSWTMRILCGYGERPERVIISAAAVILVASLIYFLVSSLWSLADFGHSLYFSAVSFTALGYGSWVSVDSAVIKGLGAAESFVGVFMMALFLVTFTRKMTR